MKYLLYILAIAISLSSCSNTYYYSTLNTNDEGVGRDKTGTFIFETDTIQLAYSFRGQDGPIKISIHNKLDRPMYVDWSKSAIIINDVATSYHGEKSFVEGGLNSYRSAKTTSGYEYNPDYISFVPPFRKVEHCSLWLSNLNFDNIDKKEYGKGTMSNIFNQKVNVKELNFSETNTPLFFESYLTIFLEDGSTYAISQSFYISNLIRAKNITPAELSQELSQKNNLMFTVVKANNTGWQAFAIGSLIVGATVLDAAFNSY